MVFFLLSGIIYSGLKPFFTSIPRVFSGKSLICHIEATTLKSFHKNFSIVFHLAGDSTTTRFFGIKKS
jgi:hypothetical protein